MIQFASYNHDQEIPSHLTSKVINSLCESLGNSNSWCKASILGSKNLDNLLLELLTKFQNLFRILSKASLYFV